MLNTGYDSNYTFVPHGNSNNMMFSAVSNNSLMYVSSSSTDPTHRGIHAISSPPISSGLYSLAGYNSGILYTWDYVTPKHMGLESNKNLMYYSIAGDNTIRSTVLPTDQTTGYMLKYTANPQSYNFTNIVSDFSPCCWKIICYTESSNSTTMVSNLNILSLYQSDRTNRITLPQLNPTKSYQIATTLRLWTLTNVYMNPPLNTTISNYKSIIAPRIKLQCDLGTASNNVLESLEMNLNEQSVQITQASVIPKNAYAVSELVSPEFTLSSKNEEQHNTFILESLLPCLELTITEIPNMVYTSIQPKFHFYSLTATTTVTSDPLVLNEDSPTVGIRTNEKLTWSFRDETKTINSITFSGAHWYLVEASMEIFFANPMLYASGSMTNAEWHKLCPQINLIWTDAPPQADSDPTTLTLITDLYANVGCMSQCYKGYALVKTSSHYTGYQSSIDLSIEYSQKLKRCSLYSWESGYQCISIKIVEI